MIFCSQKHSPSRYENKQNTVPNLKEQTDGKRYDPKKTVIYLFICFFFRIFSNSGIKDVFLKNILITFKASGLPVSKGKIFSTLIGRDTFISWAACRKTFHDIFELKNRLATYGAHANQC